MPKKGCLLFAFLTASTHLFGFIASTHLWAQTTEEYLSSPVLQPDSTTAQIRRFLVSQFRPLHPSRSLKKWEGYATPRVDSLRNLLTSIPLPRMTPISVEPRGMLYGNGFRVEKYLVQVHSGFEIPLNLYRPDSISGRMPLILNPNGFYQEGKAQEIVQARCVNFARMGYVAAAWDFVHTGERGGWNNIGLPGNNTYFSLWWRLSGANSLALTIAETKALLDYFIGLPFIDSTRVAAVGSSQGGFTALLAAATDPRIKVVVADVPPGPFKQMPFVQTDQYLEQNWFHWDGTFTPDLMARVSDFGELLSLLAPRPVMVISGILDVSPPSWIRGEIEAATPAYVLYGATPSLRHDSVFMGHDFNQEARLKAYSWVKRWFEADTTAVTSEFPYALLPLDSLRCGIHPESETILSSGSRFINSIEHQDYAPRSSTDASAMQERIRISLKQGFHEFRDSVVGITGFQFSEYKHRIGTTGVLQYASGLSTPCVFFRPRRALSQTAVVLLSDSGKATIHPALVDSLVARGYYVCAADIFGMGEMRFPVFSSRVTSFYLEMFGVTTIGIAAMQAKSVLWHLAERLGHDRIVVVAQGAMSQTVAALVSSEDHVQGVVFRDGLDAFQTEQIGSFPSKIPPFLQHKGAFQHDDLSSISALVAPKPLMISGLKNINQLLIDSSVSQTGKLVSAFYRAFSTPSLFSQSTADETGDVLSWIDRHVPVSQVYSVPASPGTTVMMDSGNKFKNKPATYDLQQNYPNPFNPSTMIQYQLVEDGSVRMDVYDVLGRLVDRLAGGFEEAGYHQLGWSPSHTLSSGVYVCRMEVIAPNGESKFSGAVKMILER